MITKELLKKIAPTAKDSIISDLEKYFDTYLPKYEVNTYLRICHFLAQCAHECDGFKTLEEYASGSAYEGRKDLGNTQKGDGVRYKGRGIIQLTGRANYRTIGAKLGVDLENNPELAATGKISVQTALEYWKSRNLNTYADQDDLAMITKRVNGGDNGYDSRKEYLQKAKQLIPQKIVFDTPTAQPVNPQITDAVTTPINIVVAKKGDNSPYVKDLQNMLIKKGAKINADGIYGSATESAVKDFQKKNKLEITGNIDTNTLNKLMVP